MEVNAFTFIFGNGIVGALLLLALRIMISQNQGNVNQRFKASEDAQAQIRADLEKDRTDLANLRAALPREYVGREDWIRFSTTIDAKQDALHRQIAESELRLRQEIRNTPPART